MIYLRNIATVLPVVVLSSTICAAQAVRLPDHSPSLTAADRKEVIATLTERLRTDYVFPDKAERVIAEINKREAAGGYANAKSALELANELTSDLQSIGNDGHFRVDFDPLFVAPPGDGGPPPEAEVVKLNQMIGERAGGISQVRRLPGNVAYLELRSFFPAKQAASYFDAAMKLTSDSDALILDLRRNGGGEQDMVAYVLSHFFAPGDERHLNDMYFPSKNQRQEYWTSPSVGQRYLKPVYVLVSGFTFSAAEECAYDFQTQKRAIVVGDSTGGGANPGEMMPIGHDLVAFIPTGQAINPITHTNWEHVGVRPDEAVPSADALTRAYSDILEAQIGVEKDPIRRSLLNQTLELAKKGEIDTSPVRPPVQMARPQ